MSDKMVNVIIKGLCPSCNKFQTMTWEEEICSMCREKQSGKIKKPQTED